MAECACCGQTLPDDLPDGLILRGKMRLLYDRVRRAGKNGIRADLLFEFMYGEDPNGGPDTGIKIIPVHVNHINSRLVKFNQRIIGSRSGHGAFAQYRMWSLNA